MKRRDFIVKSGATLASALVSNEVFFKTKHRDLIIGHGDFQYKIDPNWGALDPSKVPVKDCHEMVVDKQGRIILITNEVKNNILIYSPDGSLLDSWGHEFPGGHGLTLHDENGEEVLFICDNNRHQVIKTTLDGRVLLTLDYPRETGKYQSADQYIPTETAIADNGDIYVADGYGSQYIMHYDSQGKLLNFFGGKGAQEENFGNAHGICIDKRNGTPTLLITDRMENKLKRFSLDGKYLSTIHLPGAYICRPVIDGPNVYLATIWSNDGGPNSGFVTILDKNDKVVSAPGGSLPIDDPDEIMHQVVQVFKHPHDVCIDEDKNLYVCQWNANKVYPIKLLRV